MEKDITRCIQLISKTRLDAFECDPIYVGLFIPKSTASNDTVL